MTTVYTIGHNQKSLERFVRLLQSAGVEAIIDVRLKNTSQLAGFSKKEDLAFLLREGFGIEYEHCPDLAPTAEMLAAYRATGDWAAYEKAFLELLEERGSAQTGDAILAGYWRPCLLCAEPEPDHCHRRLIAECWARERPDLEIVHL